MANGQDLGEVNYQKFLSWIETQTNDGYREMVYQGLLNRRLVAKGTDIGKTKDELIRKIKELKEMDKMISKTTTEEVLELTLQRLPLDVKRNLKLV